MEKLVHLLVLQLEYLECYRAHTRSNQLFLASVQCRRNLKHRKCFQSIIEEKVDCVGVKFEDESLEEVNEIVDQFVARRLAKIVSDQLIEEWIPQQVKQMAMLLDILHQNAHSLDYLDVDGNVVEIQKA